MKAREKYEPEKSEPRHVLGSKCRKKTRWSQAQEIQIKIYLDCRIVNA